MASVNYEKIKSIAEAKAMLRHCDKEKRMTTEHSNKEIDRSLTYKNYQSVVDYKIACKRFDKRLGYIDNLPNANKRKDRVVMFGLDIPKPKALPEYFEKSWFKEVEKIISDFYGVENIVANYVHYDEVHKYVNPITKKEEESRAHLHSYIIPFCKCKSKKKDGKIEIVEKLSGKEFSKRSNIVSLNKKIDDMTREKFNCKWMTGEKTKSTASVEELKRASLETKKKELNSLNYSIEKQKEVLIKNKQEINSVNNELAEKRVSNKLVNSVLNIEENYKYAKEDLIYLKNNPTTSGHNRVNTAWNKPVEDINQNDDYYTASQKLSNLLEWLNAAYNHFKDLLEKILGREYEQEISETQEQLEDDFDIDI